MWAWMLFALQSRAKNRNSPNKCWTNCTPVHCFRTWNHRIAYGAPAGHSIWFVSCAEAHGENKQALVQLSCSSCIFNLTLLHPGLNFPLFWMIFFLFISGILLLNSRFGCKDATYFCCGKGQYLPNWLLGEKKKRTREKKEDKKKKKKGREGESMFLSFWVCGQISTCLPKRPLSATRTGPYLWLSSPTVLLFMNECKRLKEENFAKQKPQGHNFTFLRKGLLPRWPINCLGSFSFGPCWFWVSRSDRLYEARRMIQHLRPQLRSGGCVSTTLAAPPSGLQPHMMEEPWVMQRACWEACTEVLFTSCSLEVEEWNSWAACGQLPRWWRSWGKPKQPSWRVFLQGFRALRVLGCDWGGVCCAPVSQHAQEVWDHILPPAAGHTPGTQSLWSQPKGNVQRELLILQTDLLSKGWAGEKADSLVATCPFIPCHGGHVYCCTSFSHPDSARAAHFF